MDNTKKVRIREKNELYESGEEEKKKCCVTRRKIRTCEERRGIEEGSTVACIREKARGRRGGRGGGGRRREEAGELRAVKGSHVFEARMNPREAQEEEVCLLIYSFPCLTLFLLVL